MKLIYSIVLLILPLVAHAEITSETFCFTSGNGKPINFEMRTYYGSSSKFSSGFVKYQNSKEPIPLILTKSESEALSNDAPAQETTTWIEIYHGQATGEYEMIAQGAAVSCMVYTNKKENRKTGFVLDTSAITQDGCKW